MRKNAKYFRDEGILLDINLIPNFKTMHSDNTKFQLGAIDMNWTVYYGWQFLKETPETTCQRQCFSSTKKAMLFFYEKSLCQLKNINFFDQDKTLTFDFRVEVP